MQKNIISEHRAIKFLRANKLRKEYNQIKEKKFKNCDTLNGPQGWCDFEDNDNDLWAECTSAFQSSQEATEIHKNIYFINKELFEKTYGIEIAPKKCTSNSKLESIRTVKINTLEAIKEALLKKLPMNYPYKDKGYLEKGILIIGICDKLFGGFDRDQEFKRYDLEKFLNEPVTSEQPCINDLLLSSSFKSVELMNEFSIFDSFNVKNHYLHLWGDII